MVFPSISTTIVAVESNLGLASSGGHPTADGRSHAVADVSIEIQLPYNTLTNNSLISHKIFYKI